MQTVRNEPDGYNLTFSGGLLVDQAALLEMLSGMQQVNNIGMGTYKRQKRQLPQQKIHQPSLTRLEGRSPETVLISCGINSDVSNC